MLVWKGKHLLDEKIVFPEHAGGAVWKTVPQLHASSLWGRSQGTGMGGVSESLTGRIWEGSAEAAAP